MEALYPETLANRFDHTLSDLYERLYEADCHWSKLENFTESDENKTIRSKRSVKGTSALMQESTTLAASVSNSSAILTTLNSNASQTTMKYTDSSNGTQTTMKYTDSSNGTQTTMKYTDSSNGTQTTMKYTDSSNGTQTTMKYTDSSNGTQTTVKYTDSSHATQSTGKNTNTSRTTFTYIESSKSTSPFNTGPTKTKNGSTNTFTDEEIKNETVKRLADAINSDVTSDVTDDSHRYSIWVDIAHGLHKASITILAILFVENILKIVCMGKEFFAHKLEVFDAIVVIVSFTLDIVFLKGLQDFSTEDALFILSFLLPWRVIRVVNSLIVAVLDHEHFRLKMMYMEKKNATSELLRYKDLEERWEITILIVTKTTAKDFHIKKVESFCQSEGIPLWKVRQHTALGRKSSTVSTMASLALSGIMNHLQLTVDPKLFEKQDSKPEVPRNCSSGALSLLEIIEEGLEAEEKELRSKSDVENTIDRPNADDSNRKRMSNGHIKGEVNFAFEADDNDKTHKLVEQSSNSEDDSVSIDHEYSVHL